MNKTATVLLAASLLSLGACGSKKKNDAPAKKEEPKAEAKPVEKPAAPAEPPVQVNPDVKKMIADVVANCTIDEAGGYISDCKNGETDKYAAYVSDKSPADFYVSVAEIALTDGAKDKKTYVAAINAVSMVGWGSGKDWLKTNATKPAVDRFLKLDAQMDDNLGSSFYSMGAALPILAGRIDDLTATIQAHAPGSFKSGVIDYYATFAGAAAIPALQKFAADADEGTRGAAVSSPGAALVSAWSSAQASFAVADADKPALCDFAKGFLNDSSVLVASDAASTLGRCKGAYIDAALAMIETRSTTADWGDALANALKDQCWAESSVDAVNGTPEQCKKALAIAEKVSERTDLQEEPLRMALFALDVIGKYSCGSGYGSGPAVDPACLTHLKGVMGKFTSSSMQSVADEAKRDIDDLK